MALWIVLDIVVIGIYIGSAFYFKSKGFLKSTQTILSLVLTVVLFSMFSPVFEGVIADSAIGDYVNEQVNGAIVKEDETKEIADSGLPDFMEESLNKTIKNIDDTKNDMMRGVADETSALIIRIVASVLLFFAVKIAVSLVFKLLELFCHLKIFGFANGFLGIIVGLVNATIAIYITCAVIAVLLPPEYGIAFKEAVARTYITKIFYNDNIIIKMFM